MNTQPRFCSKCGKPLTDGQAFCGFCGAQVTAFLHNRETSQFYTPNTTNTQQTYTVPQTSVRPQKRRTYTAQKFISMGFGIGDLVVGFVFLLLGIIYGNLFNRGSIFNMEIMLGDDFYDIYVTDPVAWTDLSYAFDIAAGIMYVFAAILFIGAIIAWSMFFVYSKKRRDVMAQIALEKQQAQAQANNWNQM